MSDPSPYDPAAVQRYLRRKGKKCTCLKVWMCQSMRPVVGNRIEARVRDPYCPVHADEGTLQGEAEKA